MLSRFAHSVHIESGVVALHHALNSNTVFISDAILKETNNPNYTNSVLQDAGLLVVNKQDDDTLMASIKKAIFDTPSPISVMYLLLTDECNLACDYCFIENQIPTQQKRTYMSSRTVKAAIDLFVQAVGRHPDYFERKKTIVFYGGEPLLNVDTFRVAVKYIREAKASGALPDALRISLISNGTRITEELASFISENDVNVAISLDGNEDATNLHRKSQSGITVFEKIIQSIRMLQKNNISVGVSCTINEETLKNPKATIDFLLNEIGVSGIGYNILYRGHSLQVSSDYEQRASSLILESYEAFRERGIFENRIMRKVDAFVDKRVYPYDCAASGGRQIVVAPDGDVGICHGYIASRKHFVGSVFDDQLVVEDTPTYKMWKQRSPLTMDQCMDCLALGICGGGCPCDAESTNGSIWELDERFCIHAKMTLNWLIKDLWKNLSANSSGIKTSEDVV